MNEKQQYYDNVHDEICKICMMSFMWVPVAAPCLIYGSSFLANMAVFSNIGYSCLVVGGTQFTLSAGAHGLIECKRCLCDGDDGSS